MGPRYNVMKMALQVCGLLPQNHNPCLNMRKASDISQEILQNTQPGLLRTLKVIRNTGSLRKGSSQEEPKNTRRFHVSGIRRRSTEGEGSRKRRDPSKVLQNLLVDKLSRASCYITESWSWYSFSYTVSISQLGHSFLPPLKTLNF